MPEPTSISRRLESCIRHAQLNQHEEALIDFFPALDKTAKLRRPKAGVRDRIESFIEEQQDTIMLIACNNVLNATYNDMSFAQAIYKFGRTSIAHEGELDPRLTFDNNNGVAIGDRWNLPPPFILGLCVGVIVAKENSNEWIDNNLGCTLWNDNYRFNQLWGNPDAVRNSIEKFVRQM